MSRHNKKSFKPPTFDDGDVELRLESGEICIYATEDGLSVMIEIFQELLHRERQDHVHIDDQGILTKESIPGVVALFPQD